MAIDVATNIEVSNSTAGLKVTYLFVLPSICFNAAISTFSERRKSQQKSRWHRLEVYRVGNQIYVELSETGSITSFNIFFN